MPRLSSASKEMPSFPLDTGITSCCTVRLRWAALLELAPAAAPAWASFHRRSLVVCRLDNRLHYFCLHLLPDGGVEHDGVLFEEARVLVHVENQRERYVRQLHVEV